MPSCPNCKREWFWDWSQDILREANGAEVLRVSYNTPKLTDQDCQTTLLVCNCNLVLSVLVQDENGLTIYNSSKWGHVKWGHCKNSYQQTKGARR